MALVVVTALPAAGQSDEPAETRRAATERDSTAIALARAVDERLTVWRRADGDPVHVQHCRKVRGGCRERIATFVRWIVEAAREHDVDPFLLAAIAVRESGLDPLAEGAAGERGIVQLHPQGIGHGVRFVRSDAYWKGCGRTAGACQQEVLDVGAEHLSQAIVRCGSVEAGLGAYNSGVCEETAYARRVLAERKKLIHLAKAKDAAVVGVD